MFPSKLLLAAAFAASSHAVPVEDTHTLTRRANVPNQPPAIPPNEGDCNFQFFTQKIDHFGQHNGTFQQKYNLVTDFFKPGGPIFFYQGEEQTYLDCVDTSIGYSWAQETNGIAVVLEHRYFGQSSPFNATDPSTQQREFQYLSLDNVIADATSFLSYLKMNVTGAEDSKVIVYSGSYGGFLSTVFRQNRPDDFFGAIASAPPSHGMGNDTKTPGWYNWNIWLNNVYYDQSAEGASKLKNAIRTLEQRWTSGTNLSSLKNELGLCYKPNIDEFGAFNNLIQNVMSNNAEFNYATVRDGRSAIAWPLEKVINITLTQDDPIQIINETLWIWFGPSPGTNLDLPCLDYRNTNSLYASVPLIQQEVFLYCACKYVPVYGVGDVPSGTIFVQSSGGANETSICDQSYNISTPSASKLMEQYKYSPQHLLNSTRIIWSLAQYDPTSGVSPNQPGINAPAMSVDRNVSRILYTSNMAHREDLFAPDPSDKDTVVQTRKIELESIKAWLGWYE
ncbi:hypothetical protein AYL99_00005 [Fonsecaea erecta]|uniref:Uncharacterized protein n=1 Tax=Fonsecaea erecta TaxID=1367422 RepID=A0A178ZXM3_9EURO|nr:hypothetical protein AYL99_00005 [Fonsecaea erecta]OAP64033.1 hypothetical protein AYL99_00005 [Fonsecaea erecta]